MLGGMGLYQLARNDVDGAVKEYREAVMSSSTMDQLADQVSMLLQLQDAPEKLEERLDAVDREPAVAAALKRLNG